METKIILITGLDAGLTEVGIRSWLNRFGPVTKVRIIRKGIYDNSSALVEMGISNEAANSFASLSFLTLVGPNEGSWKRKCAPEPIV